VVFYFILEKNSWAYVLTKSEIKWLKNKIIKQNIAIIFMSFVLIAATIITVKMNSSTFVILAIFLTLRE
jgi:hypothetical protein